MHIFDILRQTLQKQFCIVFNENHVAGIGQPPADGKDRLRQLIYGGFLHPQRDSTAPRFLQQRLAELFSLVIGKSQAHALLNMTISVYLVILYHASFWFARGVEKNILILTKNYFSLTHCFMKALLFLWQRTAPPKIKNAPPPNRNCTPLTGFYQN